MKLRLRWGFAFALTFIAGFAVGIALSIVVGPRLRAPMDESYHRTSPLTYWHGWAQGNVREVGERWGDVFYMQLWIDAKSRWRTSQKAITRYRDSELRCYLDGLAGSESFERLHFARAAKLTGKDGMSPEQWREWWTTSGPSFVFTPELLADYRRWLETDSAYRRFEHEPFRRLLEAERRKLGIK